MLIWAVPWVSQSDRPPRSGRSYDPPRPSFVPSPRLLVLVLLFVLLMLVLLPLVILLLVILLLLFLARTGAGKRRDSSEGQYCRSDERRLLKDFASGGL